MIKGALYQCFETDTVYNGSLIQQERAALMTALTLNSSTQIAKKKDVIILSDLLIQLICS